MLLCLPDTMAAKSRATTDDPAKSRVPTGPRPAKSTAPTDAASRKEAWRAVSRLLQTVFPLNRRALLVYESNQRDSKTDINMVIYS